MIPILFESTATDFTTNGIGRLADAVSCTVYEERNGEYELEMEYPVGGQYYDELALRAIVAAQPSDGYENLQAFRIYSISRPISGIVTVSACHVSYDLNGIPVEPFSSSGISNALADLAESSMILHSFSFYSDIDNTESTLSVEHPMSMRSCLGGVDGSILDTFGGEYEFDNFGVTLWAARGEDQGVTIRYGKNLTDLTQEESVESTYTGVVAYYGGTETDEDGIDEEIMLYGSIQYVENHESYPQERIYVLDASGDFDEAPTSDELDERAAEYIEDNGIGEPSVNLSVSFAALWQTMQYEDIAALERVHLCDTVHVYFEKLGVDATAKVISTTYDVLKERYDEIEIGDAKSSLSETLSTIDEKVESAATAAAASYKAALAAAKAQISGYTGKSYIQWVLNSDGSIKELLIMDDVDASTANVVWRWNAEGWGVSTTGYDGEYTMAATLDGGFNATYITTGELDGSLIKADTIQVGSLTSEAIDEILGDIPETVEELTQYIVLDSDGVHVKTADGAEALIQSDGMHILVNDVEVATFTENASWVQNLTVSSYLYAGATRIENVPTYDITAYDADGHAATIDEDAESTAFMWQGDQ